MIIIPERILCDSICHTKERDARECASAKLDMRFSAIEISWATAGLPETSLTALLKDILSQYT